MAQTQKNEKKISLLKKQVARARLVANVMQAKLELAQGKGRVYASADAFMRHIARKLK